MIAFEVEGIRGAGSIAKCFGAIAAGCIADGVSNNKRQEKKSHKIVLQTKVAPAVGPVKFFCAVVIGQSFQ